MPIIIALVVFVVVAALADFEEALLLAPLAGLLALYLQTRKPWQTRKQKLSS